MFNQLRSEDVLVKVIILYNFQHLRTTILGEMYNLPCWSEKSRGTKCTICRAGWRNRAGRHRNTRHDPWAAKPRPTRHAPRGGPKRPLWHGISRHKRMPNLALNTYARNVHLNNLSHLLQMLALHKKVHFSPFSSVSAKGRNAGRHFAQRGKQAYARHKGCAVSKNDFTCEARCARQKKRRPKPPRG